LLYARMCRSYSLQALATVVAIGCLLRCLEKPGRRDVILTAAALLAAMYAHYVPGLALIAAANLALIWRRRWRDAVLLNAIVGTGLLPWAVWLAESLQVWGRHGGGYAAIGGVAEYGLKVAYWGMSFLAGEAVPDVLLIAALAIAPFCTLLIWWGYRRWTRLCAITGILTVIGFIGVARWVSYPFLPARLLFLLPLMLLLLVTGASVRPRFGAAVCSALLLLFLAGDWCYFHELGFRNKQYPMPMREIAALMEPGSLPLVDSTNSDAPALEYALGPDRPVCRTESPESEARVADPAVHAVWFLRNTHDVSTGSLNARFEAGLRSRMRLVSVRKYQPFTPWELRLMHAMGMKDPPLYFSELLEFRADGPR
ncbi:MAG TPA: hypothetical protein VNV86_18190, partial [Candidatus Acidoferrum sp.]|nr:hypothetical protein [Candidatus Acidoferrum sp.]